jgi:hypothetical protein
MKNRFAYLTLSLFFAVSICYAGSTRNYTFKDKTLNDELNNVYYQTNKNSTSVSSITIRVTDLETNFASATYFYDRGDPSGFDYTATDFIIDSNWHAKNLSAIVPSGAKVVLVYVEISAAVNIPLSLRKNGNSNNFAISEIRTQVNAQKISGNLIVACDSNQVIEYNIGGIPTIGITILGWWK